MHAQALMVAGTASHVGKSWMATAICRALFRRGVKVAPFKAQNMSNNSFPCIDGGEIGRAQVAQAEACGLEPRADMNPILLKPRGEASSQVIVQGRAWRTLSAKQYYREHERLAARVAESFERLTTEFEFVVVEGGGGIAELNLRDSDLVNLGFARRFDVPILLVADIDRGGVFASLHGTLDLLDESDRDLVRAFAVNRFRGDLELFADGVEILRRKTGKPCLGVFPFRSDIHLDKEDSVSIGGAPPEDAGVPSVAIVRLPRISNHTDFRLLPQARWIERPSRELFHTVILPGTKSPVDDLAWMRALGLDRWLLDQHARGAQVLGICGGYQMLGKVIEDPDGVESATPVCPALGLLPLRTVLLRDKITKRVRARTTGGIHFDAYEIHVGDSEPLEVVTPLAYVDDRAVGMNVGRCAGCFLHGALENPTVVEEWLGIRPGKAADKSASYDALAAWLTSHSDAEVLADLLAL